MSSTTSICQNRDFFFFKSTQASCFNRFVYYWRSRYTVKSALIQVKVVNCEKSELKSSSPNGLFIHGNGEVNISNGFKEVKLTMELWENGRIIQNCRGFTNLPSTIIFEEAKKSKVWYMTWEYGHNWILLAIIKAKYRRQKVSLKLQTRKVWK